MNVVLGILVFLTNDLMKVKDFFSVFSFQVEGPRHQSPDRGHRWWNLTLASTVAWETVFYRTIDFRSYPINQSIHHKAAWLHTHFTPRPHWHTTLLSYCAVYDSFVTALIQFVEETKTEFNGQCIYIYIYIYICQFTNRSMGYKPWTRHRSRRDQSIGLDIFL